MPGGAIAQAVDHSNARSQWQALVALSEAQIAAILGTPDRTTADRDNDRRRKPEQILGFIGLRPGMTALDVVVGGGYTSELAARARQCPRDRETPEPPMPKDEFILKFVKPGAAGN